MSFSGTLPPNLDGPVQHFHSLTVPKSYRPNSSRQEGHNRSASLTSNPVQTSQESQQVGDELRYWPSDQSTNLPFASPASLLQPVNLYNFAEETSHHESSFDEFLTTECSSENHISEHTTPQELIWEREFLYQDSSEFQLLDNYGHNNYSADQVCLGGTDPNQPLPKFISEPELLNSKLNISNLHPRHLEAQPVAQGQSQSMAGSSASFQSSTGSHNLKVSTNQRQSPGPKNGAGARQNSSPTMRSRSPIVMISSYEATSAYNPIQPQGVQSSSKRSHGGQGGEDEGEDQAVHHSAYGDVTANSPHLMPPGPIESSNVRIIPAQRTGLEPAQRSDLLVLSIQDLEEQRQRDERNAEVQTWLATSDAGSESENDPSADKMRRLPFGRRRRAHTTGQVDALGRVYSDKGIPGPGVLVEVESDDEYSEDSSVTSSQMADHTEQILDAYYNSELPSMSPQALNGRDSPDKTAFPALEDEIPPELQEPLPRQFYRRSPWQDPVQGPVSNTRDQPSTANAAAYRFNQEAAKWETASRAATWGTRRRLSESEIRSIVEGSQVRHLSLSKRGRERGNSILNKARGLLPRRSSSNIKPDASEVNHESPAQGRAHRSSFGTIKPTQRKPSFSNKPKSPQLNTGSALMAMTGQLAAIGRGNPVTQHGDTNQSSGPLQALKKQRSKSDVSKHGKSSTPGLTELMTRHGGPPIPTLASPMHEREPVVAAQMIDNEDAPADDDEDDQADEVGIRMDLEIRPEDIIPTLEGFKDHARKLNPRLEPYLIERIGQEQIRRYKKLVETKVKHTRAVQMTQNCPSGKFCFDLGGQAMLLAPRASSKDPEATLTQFQVSNPADNEIDESGFTEGIVTPALFPRGVPLPPVKRLPAELECPLCFKIKKFQKPSDWTKHVHEDIQPFTCTFPHCTEAKSFKRKADWVRHENERHRHLEWWKCSIQECSHVCFRKDNFVQHLVREHKMKEPKVRGRGSGSSKSQPVSQAVGSSGQEDKELWHLVDTCRHETTNKPRDEPCRFCGNVCSSFKKLSVHMGKHMEQIAMPVLRLVSMREVAPDTIISPIDPVPTASLAFPTGVGTAHNMDANNLSPYPTSATSAYQTSSTGQSPASIPGRSRNGGFHFEPAFYSPHAAAPMLQAPMAGGAYGSSVCLPPHSQVYMGASEYMPPGDVGRQHEYSVSPQSATMTPRSQPVAMGFNQQFFGSTGLDYTQEPMGAMYPVQQTAPGFGPQYASSMLHDPSDHSPMAMGSRSGLGLQTANANYGFGPSEDGGPGPNMPYMQ